MSVSMANPTLKPASIDPETSRIKVPPHSVEAEQAVLGGLMLDNRRFDEIAEIISAADEAGLTMIMTGIRHFKH
mgnify:CR=1 FL=1